MLIASELFDNAIEHGATTDGQLVMVFVCRLPGARIYVSVTDPGRPSGTRPVLRHADPLALRGRGLALVDELSEQWGSRPYGTGTRVFALIGSSEP